MIAESVAFLVARGQARGLRRRALLRRLPRRPGLRARCLRAAAEAGAETRRAVRHQRRARCRRQIARGDRAPWSPRSASVRARHPLPRRRRLRRGQLARRRRGGRDAGAGHDERLRRALRQRQPRHDHRRTCSSSWATTCSRREQLARLTETAHFVDELLNLTPDPDQPYVGSNAFAHKGGMHVAGVHADPAHVRAHRPGRGRQPPRRC